MENDKLNSNESNILKIGNVNFSLINEKSSLDLDVENGKITECSLFCKFNGNEYDGIEVFPNIEINNIVVLKDKIEDLVGNLFELNDVNLSYERDDSFYLYESEPFESYKINVLEIDNVSAHILISGIGITDGYSEPYKVDKFIADVNIPVKIHNITLEEEISKAKNDAERNAKKKKILMKLLYFFIFFILYIIIILVLR